MKKLCIVLFCLSVFACTNNANTTEHSNQMPTQEQKATIAQKYSQYQGKIMASFEELEFVHNDTVYYIVDKENLVSNKLKNIRTNNQNFYVLDTVCLFGELMDKSQNKGRGFGHLEKYDKAIVVYGLC